MALYFLAKENLFYNTNGGLLCVPKDKGGLGILNLELQNECL
jgi:hypothetical protein